MTLEQASAEHANQCLSEHHCSMRFSPCKGGAEGWLTEEQVCRTG